MTSWIYIIGFIAVMTVIILVVGYIGNKAVDKTENALRDRRLRNQDERAEPAASLAKKFSDAQRVKPKQVRQARFCTECGESLAADARFCPSCGKRVGAYKQ